MKKQCQHRDLLQAETWTTVYGENDVNTAFNNFLDIFLYDFDIAALKTPRKINKHEPG